MKILALRTHWFPDNTPGSRRFESFLNSLSQSNEVVLYAPAKNDVDDKFIFNFKKVKVPNYYFNPTYQKYVGRVRRFASMFDYFVSFGKIVELAIDEDISSGENFDCILTTYQNISSVKVAARLGKKYNIPWFCDVRDLPNQFLPLGQLNTEANYLYGLLKNAKGVTTTNQALCNRMKSEALIDNTQVVYNGLPISLLRNYTENIAKYASGGVFFDIVYAGSLYAGRKLDPLLDAVIKLSNINNIRVIVLGSIKDREKNRYLNKYNQIIEFKGLLSLEELTSYYKRASILVNLHPESHKDAIPSKIFEYAATGRPILNLSPTESFVSEFIGTNAFGTTLIHQDDCERWLLDKIADWKNCTFVVPNNRMEKLIPFTRENQASIFEAFINSSLDE
jgi:hypothetical protein